MVSLGEVLGAFSAATHVSAPNLAGALWVVCGGVGGVLVLTWIFRVGQDAVRGSALHAPQALLLALAAFFLLIATVGVFYR